VGAKNKELFMSDTKFIEIGHRIISVNSIDSIKKNQDTSSVNVTINGNQENFMGEEADKIWDFFSTISEKLS
jgi:hypothetical protein